MLYKTFEGKTKKEAMAALNEEKKIDSRYRDARIIDENEIETSAYLGLKKGTRYTITVGVPEHIIPRDTGSKELANSPFSSIEQRVISNNQLHSKKSIAKNKASKEELLEETLFAIQNAGKVTDKIAEDKQWNLKKNDEFFKITQQKNLQRSQINTQTSKEFSDLSKEINELKDILHKQHSLLHTHQIGAHLQLDRSLPNEENISLQHSRWIERYLCERNFSYTVIDGIMACLNQKPEIFKDKSLILKEVETFLLKNIPQNDINLDDYSLGSNIILVGPTGVGKSNTLVKLSIHLAYMRKKEFRYIYMDQDQLGGESTLEKYAKYIDVNHNLAHKLDEFMNLFFEDNYQYTFIDTNGKSPSDKQGIQDLVHWIESIGENVNTHLVVSACTKAQDLEYICEAYKCTNFSHILVSKVDESQNLGSILSLSYKIQKPISFITNGQEIPQDFGIANIKKIIKDSLN